MNVEHETARVFVYEDDTNFIQIINSARELAKERVSDIVDFEFKWIKTIDEFNDWLSGEHLNIGDIKFSILDVDIDKQKSEGFRAATELRKRASLGVLPIVFFTKHSGKTIKKKAYASGANSFIRKPTDKQDKANLLAQILIYWHENRNAVPETV